MKQNWALVIYSSADFGRQLKEIMSLACCSVISVLEVLPQAKCAPVSSAIIYIKCIANNFAYFKYAKCKAWFLVKLVRSHQEDAVISKLFQRK